MAIRNISRTWWSPPAAKLLGSWSRPLRGWPKRTWSVNRKASRNTEQLRIDNPGRVPTQGWVKKIKTTAFQVVKKQTFIQLEMSSSIFQDFPTSSRGFAVWCWASANWGPLPGDQGTLQSEDVFVVLHDLNSVFEHMFNDHKICSFEPNGFVLFHSFSPWSVAGMSALHLQFLIVVASLGRCGAMVGSCATWVPNDFQIHGMS